MASATSIVTELNFQSPAMSTTSAFIAGLVTALALSTSMVLLIWRRDAVMRGLVAVTKRGREVVLGVLADLGARRWNLTVNSEERDVKGAGAEEEEVMFAKEKKPFEFRKRLWHEPPELEDITLQSVGLLRMLGCRTEGIQRGGWQGFGTEDKLV